MAEDFGLFLKPMPPEATAPPIRRLTPATELPWNRPFACHIVAEALFTGPVDEESAHGAFLPQPPRPPRPSQATEWRLPATPPLGLTAVPSWNGQEPPAHLIAAVPDPRQWPLGRSRSGHPLQVPGRINIYGRQEAMADWLIPQVTQMMALDPANLVVIDGAGDLVPQLKRKAVVTRLLGDRLAYLDLDNASLTNGFNLLAAVPGEAEEALVGRWGRWFQGMDVHPQGVGLLARARQAGVEDIPGLRKWLRKAERQGQVAAASSLGLALNRLMASRSLREWLEWPSNRFHVLPAGALFFACKGLSWDRCQLLRGVLLAALAVPNGRLIVHGFPWKALNKEVLQQHERMIITGGPPLPGSTTILVESPPQYLDKLVERFLAGDPQLGENLALLNRGESLVVGSGPAVTFVTWRAIPVEADDH
jgi:hypothetical protein